MKKIMSVVLAMALVACLGSLPARAQQGGNGGGGRMLPEMKARLNLSADQLTKIQALFQSFHQQNKGQQPSQQAKAQLHQQIMKVLNKDQQAKFKQMLQERRQQKGSN